MICIWCRKCQQWRNTSAFCNLTLVFLQKCLLWCICLACCLSECVTVCVCVCVCVCVWICVCRVSESVLLVRLRGFVWLAFLVSCLFLGETVSSVCLYCVFVCIVFVCLYLSVCVCVSGPMTVYGFISFLCYYRGSYCVSMTATLAEMSLWEPYFVWICVSVCLLACGWVCVIVFLSGC